MKTRHPLLVKWFAAARASGKDYKTLRGLVRFARAELAKPSCESEWKPRWKARCFSDEERQIRRALNDKKYRTELVARLRAEHKQRMKMPKDMAAACAKLEFFLDEKKSNDSRYNTAQRILKQVGARCLDSLTKNLTKLDISARTAEMLGVKIVRRGKDWGVYPSLCKSEFVHEDGTTFWKNGRPRKYERATNDNFVRSFAIVRGPRVADGMFHETVLRLELPEKYCFDIDANGLRIVRQSDNADLHITADDFIRMTKGAYNWQAQLEQNLQRRLANAEADARNQAESAKAEASRKMMEDIRAGKRSVLSGVYVTIQDSVSGGNCIAGTNAFIERCGLKKRSIVSASALTRICKAKAPESLDRLALAIAAAKKRIEQRMSGLAPCPLTQIHARTA